MSAIARIDSLLAQRTSTPNLPWVVDAIGRREFGWRLLSFLHAMCGADHCATYRIDRGSVAALSSGSLDGAGLAHRRTLRYLADQFWRRDPAISEAVHCIRIDQPLVIRMQLDRLCDTDLRQVIYPDMGDRLVVAGARTGSAFFSLSILRSEGHGHFSEEDVERVRAAADLLLSLLAKHADWEQREPARALAAAADIEQCIRDSGAMPLREAQVCARVLRGVSTAGIALELGVGVESVKTYRKRAYQRLAIGSERELLSWYLACWSAWRGSGGQGMLH